MLEDINTKFDSIKAKLENILNDQIQETKGMTLQTKYLQNLKNLGHRYLSRVLFIEDSR